MWLKIDPDQVAGAIKLRLTGKELPGSLEFIHSSSMELTSASSEQGLGLKLKEQSVGSQLQIPAEFTLPLNFELKFSLSRPAVGKIHFPYFYVSDAQRVRRLFAATISPELDFQEVQRSKLRPLSSAEFATLWGEQSPSPTLAYALLSRTPDWALQVNPIEDLVVASQSLDLHCQSLRADLSYEATLVNSDGMYSFRVSVPESLSVDELTLSGSQRYEIPLRWTRPEPTIVEVFTASPLSESCELQILGSLDYQPSPEFSLPRISLIDAEQSPLNLRVNRSSEVVVELYGAPSETGTASQPFSQTVDRGNGGSRDLPVFDLELTRYAYPDARLRVAPLESNFSASLAGVLVSETAADFVVSLETFSGRLERFTISTSPEWQPRASAGNSYLLQNRGTGTKGERLYEVLLTAPLHADHQTVLRIPGTLSSVGDAPLKTPRFQLLNGRTESHYVVVPSKLNNDFVDWQLRGLQRERIQGPIAAAIPEISQGLSLRAVRQNSFAVRRVFPETMRHAAIRFAETSTVLDEHGNWSATTRYVLQPARATSCMLKLPPRSKLLALEVAGRRYLPRVNESGVVELTFGPPYLPVEIAITYLQAAGRSFSAKELQVPQLIMADRVLPINEMQWHITANDASLVQSRTAPLSDRSPVRSLDARTFQRSRIAARLAALTDAAPLARQLHPWEARQWFAPWERKIGNLLDTSTTAEPSSHAGNVQEARRLVFNMSDWESWESLGKLFGEEDLSIPKALSNHNDVPLALRAEQNGVSNYYYQTQRGNRLKLRDTSRLPSWPKWFVAAMLVLIAVIAHRNAQRLQQLIENGLAGLRPATVTLISPTVGLFAGLIWWWWLSPGVLGLLVATLAAASLVRQLFARLFARRRRVRHLAYGSTINQPTSP